MGVIRDITCTAAMLNTFRRSDTAGPCIDAVLQQRVPADYETDKRHHRAAAVANKNLHTPVTKALDMQ